MDIYEFSVRNGLVFDYLLSRLGDGLRCRIPTSDGECVEGKVTALTREGVEMLRGDWRGALEGEEKCMAPYYVGVGWGRILVDPYALARRQPRHRLDGGRGLYFDPLEPLAPRPLPFSAPPRDEIEVEDCY